MSSEPEGPEAPASIEAIPVGDDLLAEMERIAALLEGRSDHADIARRFEWLVDVLVQRGNLAPGHRRLLGKLKRAQSTVKLALFRDKRAIAGAELDCAARLPLCHAACCHFTVTLSAQDVEERRLRWELHEPYVLKRDPDSGRCIYLRPDGCSVYADRPGACRAYDCRRDSRVWEDFERRIPAARLRTNEADPDAPRGPGE